MLSWRDDGDYGDDGDGDADAEDDDDDDLHWEPRMGLNAQLVPNGQPACKPTPMRCRPIVTQIKAKLINAMLCNVFTGVAALQCIVAKIKAVIMSCNIWNPSTNMQTYCDQD